MMKFKTVIGRIAYSDEFDSLIGKELANLDGKVEDIKIATSDRMIVAIIMYTDKKKSSK